MPMRITQALLTLASLALMYYAGWQMRGAIEVCTPKPTAITAELCGVSNEACILPQRCRPDPRCQLADADHPDQGGGFWCETSHTTNRRSCQ